MILRRGFIIRLVCVAAAVVSVFALAPPDQQPLQPAEAKHATGSASQYVQSNTLTHALSSGRGKSDAGHLADGRSLSFAASLAGAGSGTTATAGGTADAIMKNMLIVIAAVSLGILVAVAVVAYMLWKSGLLSMFSKAQGIPDPMGFVPTEATDLATEVGGAPSAPPDEKKK